MEYSFSFTYNFLGPSLLLPSQLHHCVNSGIFTFLSLRRVLSGISSPCLLSSPPIPVPCPMISIRWGNGLYSIMDSSLSVEFVSNPALYLSGFISSRPGPNCFLAAQILCDLLGLGLIGLTWVKCPSLKQSHSWGM